jgi:hypothetical protein
MTVKIRPPSYGLDLSNLEVTTPAEVQAFRDQFGDVTGRIHPGQQFWLEHKPDVLKRYRLYSNYINDPNAPGLDEDEYVNPNLFGFVYLYGMTGFDEGVRYIVHGEQHYGLTKAEILEGIAAAFIYLGPRGMDTVAKGLAGFEWKRADRRPRFPDNWAPDPEAFRSGIDPSTPHLTPDEREKLVAWYQRVEGEVPDYVPFMADHRPEMLKTYRIRFENAIRLLPKQVMPYMMIHINVTRGFREGIRESVLLAKGFGMTKAQTIEALAWGMFYGGTESGSIVQRVTGDILAKW